MPKKIDVPLVDNRLKYGDPIGPVVDTKLCPCPAYQDDNGSLTKHPSSLTKHHKCLCGHPRYHHPNLGRCTVEIPIPQNIGKRGAYIPGEETLR